MFSENAPEWFRIIFYISFPVCVLSVILNLRGIFKDLLSPASYKKVVEELLAELRDKDKIIEYQEKFINDNKLKMTKESLYTAFSRYLLRCINSWEINGRTDTETCDAALKLFQEIMNVLPSEAQQ